MGTPTKKLDKPFFSHEDVLAMLKASERPTGVGGIEVPEGKMRLQNLDNAGDLFANYAKQSGINPADYDDLLSKAESAASQMRRAGAAAEAFDRLESLGSRTLSESDLPARLAAQVAAGSGKRGLGSAAKLAAKGVGGAMGLAAGPVSEILFPTYAGAPERQNTQSAYDDVLSQLALGLPVENALSSSLPFDLPPDERAKAEREIQSRDYSNKERALRTMSKRKRP